MRDSSLKTRCSFVRQINFISITKKYQCSDKTVTFTLKQSDFDMIKGQYVHYHYSILQSEVRMVRLRLLL